MQFLIKKIFNTDIVRELDLIGFDKPYRSYGADKHVFLTLKIFNLTSPQINILKQTALSVGTDCGTNRHVIDCKVERSNCILSGSISELKKISEKLKFQPFGLKNLAEKIEEQIAPKKPKKPLIMGILNITKDSFSDGGKFFDTKAAVEHGLKMLKEGVNIIDTGAESTRPNYSPVDEETQIERLLPVIKILTKEAKGAVISVDTRSSNVALKAIEAGAKIINDVSALSDKNMLEIAEKTGSKLVLTSNKGAVDEVYLSLAKMIEKAYEAGINKRNLIVDVGAGFGKTQEENFELVKRMKEFTSLNLPVLAGVSRKSMMNFISDTPENRDEATAMLDFWLLTQGVEILRVHNIKLAKQAVNLFSNLF